MSEPQYIVLPVQGQAGQSLQSNGAVNVSDTNQLQKQMAQIAQTIQRNNVATKQKKGQEMQSIREEQVAEQPSFVKQITSNPSILYSFINWENPGRTLASFITVLSFTISTRYFSPSYWTLKILCIVLGATFLFGIVGRVATKDGLTTRVQPQPYYRPSKRTYSRFFSELQEVIDMILVKLQKIILAENLRDTGAAFALSFMAYWLVKVIPTFWLAIIATLFTYSLGPILKYQFSDPNAANMKPIINQKAQDLKHHALDTASSATNRAVNAAQNLSSQALDTASSSTDPVSQTAQDLKNRTIDTTSFGRDHTAATAQDVKNHLMETTYSAIDGIGETDYESGAQHVRNYRNDAPLAPEFDQNNLSKDHRNQLHPLESQSINMAFD